MNNYFFDTYALFEIIFGNKKFLPYAEAGGITTIFNIAELNYGLKKIKSKEESDKLTDTFKSSTVKVIWEDILIGMNLKTNFRDLSIPDAIGYAVAKRYKIKFLTGDEGFKNLENVEFIKK